VSASNLAAEAEKRRILEAWRRFEHLKTVALTPFAR